MNRIAALNPCEPFTKVPTILGKSQQIAGIGENNKNITQAVELISSFRPTVSETW